jgi:hypothetical protein
MRELLWKRDYDDDGTVGGEFRTPDILTGPKRLDSGSRVLSVSPQEASVGTKIPAGRTVLKKSASLLVQPICELFSRL